MVKALLYYTPKEASMLMRTRDETIARIRACDNDFDDKPGKWERDTWESLHGAQSLRNPTPDCDTKRTGPCKAQADSKK